MKLTLGRVIGKCAIVPSQCCKPMTKKQGLNKVLKVYMGNLRQSRAGSLMLRVFTTCPWSLTEHGFILAHSWEECSPSWWGRHTNRSSQVYSTNEDHKQREGTPALTHKLLFFFPHFYLVWDPSPWDGIFTFRSLFSLSSRNILTGTPTSHPINGLVFFLIKLTISASHHTVA